MNIECFLEQDCVIRGDFISHNISASNYMFEFCPIEVSPQLQDQLLKILETIIVRFARIQLIVLAPELKSIVQKVSVQRRLTYHCLDENAVYEPNDFNPMNNMVIIDTVFQSPERMNKIYSLLQHSNCNVKQHIVIYDHELYDTSNYSNFTSIMNKTSFVQYKSNMIQMYKNSDLCFTVKNDMHIADFLQTMQEIGEKLIICKIHIDLVDEKWKQVIIENAIHYDFLIMVMVDTSVHELSHYRKMHNWVDFVEYT